jgi:hypothetical protein
MTEEYESATDRPVMTSDEHHCGKKLHRVGSDRVLFCPRCRTQVSEDQADV